MPRQIAPTEPEVQPQGGHERSRPATVPTRKSISFAKNERERPATVPTDRITFKTSELVSGGSNRGHHRDSVSEPFQRKNKQVHPPSVDHTPRSSVGTVPKLDLDIKVGPLMRWSPEPRPMLVNRAGTPLEIGTATSSRPWSANEEEVASRPRSLRPGSQAKMWNNQLQGVQSGKTDLSDAEKHRDVMQRLKSEREALMPRQLLKVLGKDLTEMDKSVDEFKIRDEQFTSRVLIAQEHATELLTERTRLQRIRARRKKAEEERRRENKKVEGVHDHNKETSFGRTFQAARDFQGGAMKRAKDILEGKVVPNVHDVAEVQKITSSVNRVGTKIEYYRDCDEHRDNLVNAIEKSFMEVEAITHAPIVSLGRLRSKLAKGNWRGDDSASMSGHSSPGSPSSPKRGNSPVNNFPVPPALQLERQEASVSNRLARMRHAKARARNLNMDRRVNQLLALRHRMTRRDEAERARPWLVNLVVCLSVATFRAVTTTYHEARKTAARLPDDASNSSSSSSSTSDEDNDEAARLVRFASELSERRNRMRRHRVTWNVGMTKLRTMTNIGDNQRILRFEQVDIINRRAMREIMQQTNFQRKSRIWMKWRHLLGVNTFLVRLMAPLRRHKQMDMCRHFIENSWRGMLIRKTVKNFIFKVRVIQQHMRQAFKIARFVQTHIYMPMIWVEETMLIAKAVGYTAEKMRALEVVANVYLSACNIDVARSHVERLIEQRDGILKTKGFLERKRLSDLVGSPALTRRSPRAPRRAAPQRRKENVIEVHFENDEEQSQQTVARMMSEAGVKAVRNVLAGQSREPNNPASADNEAALTLGVGALTIIEEYRLPLEQHEQIALELYRATVRRWWDAYRGYKADIPIAQKQFARWFNQIQGIGSTEQTRELWPEPPTVPEYPREIAKCNVAALDQLLLKELQTGRAAEIM